MGSDGEIDEPPQLPTVMPLATTSASSPAPLHLRSITDSPTGNGGPGRGHLLKDDAGTPPGEIAQMVERSQPLVL